MSYSNPREGALIPGLENLLNSPARCFQQGSAPWLIPPMQSSRDQTHLSALEAQLQLREVRR